METKSTSFHTLLCRPYAGISISAWRKGLHLLLNMILPWDHYCLEPSKIWFLCTGDTFLSFVISLLEPILKMDKSADITVFFVESP